MRAITIKQPCAHLVVVGRKPIENRSKPWPSTLELPCRIGIHAGKGDHAGCWEAVGDERPEVVYGALIGFATVVAFHHADECARSCMCWCHAAGSTVGHDSRCCGEPCDGTVSRCGPSAMPGMWHYELEDPEPLAEPIPMRGALGLWRLPEGVAA